jgi:hypothetical protein
MIQLHVTKYLSGNPSRTPDGVSLAINKRGIPVSLGILQELIDSKDVKQLRLLYTLLNVRRVWEFKSNPNLEPIRLLHHGSSFLEAEVTAVVKDLGWKLPQPHWVDPHLSTKAGPNGIATLSSIEDRHAIPDGLGQDLSILGGSNFLSYFKVLGEYHIDFAA